MYDKLDIGDIKPAAVKLQLVDRSYILPIREIENLLIKVDKFIFLLTKLL